MRKVILLLLLAGAAAAGYFYWQRRPEPTELVLAGSLEARTVEVGSLIGGRVARVLVDEGDRVQPGQLLIEFEGDLLGLQILEQKAAIDEAQATLAKTTKGPRAEEVRRAEIDWQAAKTDRERFESLWTSGVTAKRDFDTASVREANALETLRQAQRGGRSDILRREDQELGATTDGRIVNHEVRICDPVSGAVLPAGVEGEIATRGPEVMVGYTDWSQTEEAFDAAGYFRMGDLGYISHGDFITVSGRKKDLIIRGGENLSPKDRGCAACASRGQGGCRGRHAARATR